MLVLRNFLLYLEATMLSAIYLLLVLSLCFCSFETKHGSSPAKMCCNFVCPCNGRSLRCLATLITQENISLAFFRFFPILHLRLKYIFVWYVYVQFGP